MGADPADRSGGMRALLGGCFAECERLAAGAAALPGDPSSALLTAALRREQGRPGEAEAVLRGGGPRDPSTAARALLAAVLADLGRDREAASLLSPLAADGFAPLAEDADRLFAGVVLAEVCAVLGDGRAAEALAAMLLPDAGRLAVDATGSVCAGSASRALGLCAHTLARWDRAVVHLEAALGYHAREGAPVLVAHTRRDLAATLRARGGPGDWERATDLLRGAAAIYRRLGIDRQAAAAHAVLRGHDAPDPGVHLHLPRRDGDGWLVGPPDRPVRLDPSPGLADLGVLLSSPGRGVHVLELVGAAGPPAGPDLVARLEELERQAAAGGAGGDRVGASVARAERDLLATLVAAPPDVDALERARAAVGARIRLGIDRIAGADPALADHLRLSVRTGTFCAYEPPRPRALP